MPDVGALPEVRVRERLPRDLLWFAGFFCVWIASISVVALGRRGLGMDSHAYWGAWRGDLYDGAPATLDAYLYSPVFAQLIWPLAQLPWPAFGLAWFAASLAALMWLVRAREWYVAVPLLLVGAPALVSGNVDWLLAVVAAVGLRHPWVWALPLLTKVTPCLGPLWYLVRGEWRNLAVSLGAVAVVVGASCAVAPDLWRQWLTFLVEHSGATDEQLGSALLPPLAWRLPLVLALVAWGARTDRAWVLPVGMILASPVVGPSQLALLLALPRLAQRDVVSATSPRPTGRASTALRRSRWRRPRG